MSTSPPRNTFMSTFLLSYFLYSRPSAPVTDFGAESPDEITKPYRPITRLCLPIRAGYLYEKLVRKILNKYLKNIYLNSCKFVKNVVPLYSK